MRTVTVIEGLEDPTPDEWTAWHDRIRAERMPVHFDARTDWSDATFRQLFLFLYDTSLFDGRWRIAERIPRWRESFGRIDEVLLWHAYPRLGFDERTQFDFYRGMPGGLAALRSEVSDVLHAEGIRVFVDYNPWDKGTYDELAAIVRAIDADGVMLDTMTSAPGELQRALGSGIVLAPELAPKDEDLRVVRQSWAQWYEIGEGPTIYRHPWLVRQHRCFAIARWDTSRRRDIVYSFFNGQGLVIWENIFGSWNPYSDADRRLLVETSAVLDRYGDLFVREWHPLIPTGVRGLDANRWTDGTRALITFRNRTDRTLHWRATHPCKAFWGEAHAIDAGDAVAVEPHGTQAIVIGDS